MSWIFKMPRAKKPRRADARIYKSYDGDDSMKRAVEEVRGSGSYKADANLYGINRTTLMNHIKGMKCKKIGRPTVLTVQEEEILVHTLVKLGEWGYGFDRLQLQHRVQDYVRRMERPNPFHNGMPGPDWCLMFERR
ncbi:hypothetical protein NQ314_008462 [Rhamnusium bicolor]|uniref:HTH psq-type domain-containing protein n=1 Tax=Rhamnusium bicolor TaxID=1586634 RepID=A0AAV8Y9P9_9CUCU|nr:hypothetical protein NQ314_008462 [Rhamnusium bicolor]